MSGMKTLANAIANDPSFISKCDGLISKQEAAQFVPQGMGGKGSKMKGSSKSKTPKIGKSSKGGY